MRHGLAIYHCVDADTQAKLAAMCSEPEPVNVMVPWDATTPKLQQALDDYYHEKMIDRIMRMPPTRSRNY